MTPSRGCACFHPSVLAKPPGVSSFQAEGGSGEVDATVGRVYFGAKLQLSASAAAMGTIVLRHALMEPAPAMPSLRAPPASAPGSGAGGRARDRRRAWCRG